MHAEDFQYSKSFRLKARKQLNINPDDIVVLFVGRLSFHGKAHPLVMYQALERAAAITGQKVVLIECGWHANSSIQKAFETAASTICQKVRHITLNGRDPNQLKLSWASADIFCSLSDNIQETFGITPIEAMAAGLPVVVSDWDGYRDTVREGIDGFRIPTLMPPPGSGDELASRHALGIDNYDMYCAYASSLVAVDLACATQAFTKLISSGDLRQKMGTQGRQRVLNHYDWKAIIPVYESLWNDLKNRRDSEPEYSRKSYAWPSRLDPFYGFASYPTRKIQMKSLLSLSESNSNVAIERFRQLIRLDMVNYISARMASQEQLESVLMVLDNGPTTAKELISNTCNNVAHARKLFLSIIWMVKLGLIDADQ